MRQVALVEIKNYGTVLADDVILKARKMTSRATEQNGRWNVRAQDGTYVTYSNLSSVADGWEYVEIQLGTLMGSDVSSDKFKTMTVALASLSGSTDFYGTILIPDELLWTDPIKKEQKSKKLNLDSYMAPNLSAEIGSLSSKTCKKLSASRIDS